MSLLRLQRVLAHIHGDEPLNRPLWAETFDSDCNPLERLPLGTCRCLTGKWRLICQCFPCLENQGRAADFEWTPTLVNARPDGLPPAWQQRGIGGWAAAACAGEPSRSKVLPLEPEDEQLSNEVMLGVSRLTRPGGSVVGQISPGIHPRYGQLATFARLPTETELQVLQIPDGACLFLRPLMICASVGSPTSLNLKASVGNTRLSFDAHMVSGSSFPSWVFSSIDSGLKKSSINIELGDSCLELEVNGARSNIPLWTLPLSRWHKRVIKFEHAVGEIRGLELEVELHFEKHSKTSAPKVDIGILGVPFDSGCSFRPGARFGPEAIRAHSRLIRPYMIAVQQRPLISRQLVDYGDVTATPFGVEKAVEQIYQSCCQRLKEARRLVLLGGDHSLSYPAIKACAEKFGPVVLIHFDSHLDTFPAIFGQNVWHGGPFRNCWEENLLAKDGSTHVGIRTTTYCAHDLRESDAMGIATLTSEDVFVRGVPECVKVVRQRYEERGGGAPVYLSIDIDVLDPSVAPGTGTPESGGLMAYQLLQLIRGLKGLPIVGADLVEVAPAYDHAGITAIAASNLVLEEIALIDACMDVDGF